MKIITQIRSYKAKATIGELYVEDSLCCYTLEDVARPDGVKIPGETCIPEGCYLARVTLSKRFAREMILLSSVGKDVIMRDGITFSGLRVHKGNTVEDTEGCVLVGEHTNHEDKIWKCSGPDNYLLNLVKQEGECLWVITSK